MKRPVRPMALTILTVCMLYPGLGFLYQGVYPFVTGEYFNIVGQVSPWLTWAAALHVAPVLAVLLELALGVAWFAGVLGLWLGEARAVPVVAAAAVVTLLYPGGGILMALIALFVLFRFREDDKFLPA